MEDCPGDERSGGGDRVWDSLKLLGLPPLHSCRISSKPMESSRDDRISEEALTISRMVGWKARTVFPKLLAACIEH